MIGYLQGKVLHLSDEGCLLYVQGIGYRITLNRQGLSTLGLHQEASLWIESVVHEGQTRLFGFIAPEEQAWFCWLTQVPGVGGRVAQNILSILPPAPLHQAILAGQASRLKEAEGVGPKLAARIVTELRDKAHQWAPPSFGSSHSHSSYSADAMLALCALGYRRHDVERVLQEIQEHEPGSDLEHQIKLGLHKLASLG